MIQKLTSAYTAADLDSLLALLTEDVRLTMPPHPFEYRGRTVAAQGLGQLFAQGHRYQLIETRANGQPAFALYRKDPHADVLHASGLLVITLTGPQVKCHDHVREQCPGPLRPAQDPARMKPEQAARPRR